MYAFMFIIINVKTIKNQSRFNQKAQDKLDTLFCYTRPKAVYSKMLLLGIPQAQPPVIQNYFSKKYVNVCNLSENYLNLHRSYTLCIVSAARGGLRLLSRP